MHPSPVSLWYLLSVALTYVGGRLALPGRCFLRRWRSRRRTGFLANTHGGTTPGLGHRRIVMGGGRRQAARRWRTLTLFGLVAVKLRLRIVASKRVEGGRRSDGTRSRWSFLTGQVEMGRGIP